MKISLRIKRLLSNRKMTKQQAENDEETKTMNKCICGFSFLEKYFHFVFN